jgi:hypothetical protein
LKTKDEDLQKWAKRRQPLEKKGFATETQSHKGGLESGVYPTPPGNADGYQNKGLAGKAIRKNMKTKDEQNRLLQRHRNTLKARTNVLTSTARTARIGVRTGRT